MKNLFRKTLLLALMAALAAASLPLAGALAAGTDDPLPRKEKRPMQGWSAFGRVNSACMSGLDTALNVPTTGASQWASFRPGTRVVALRLAAGLVISAYTAGFVPALSPVSKPFQL